MGSKPICVLGLFYHDLFVEIQVYFQSHISIKSKKRHDPRVNAA